MPISRLVRRFPRRSLAITAAPLCTALALLSLVLAPAHAFASDSPGNYYYGADSGNPTALGTGPIRCQRWAERLEYTWLRTDLV